MLIPSQVSYSFTKQQNAMQYFLFAPTMSLEVCHSGVKPQPNYSGARWPSMSPTTLTMLAHSSSSHVPHSIFLFLTGSDLLLSVSGSAIFYQLPFFFKSSPWFP